MKNGPTTLAHIEGGANHLNEHDAPDWRNVARVSMSLLLALMRDCGIWEVRLAMANGADGEDINIRCYEADGESVLSCVAVCDLPNTHGQWHEIPPEKVRLLRHGTGGMEGLFSEIGEWLREARP